MNPNLEQRAEAAIAGDALRKETERLVSISRTMPLKSSFGDELTSHLTALQATVDAQSAEVKRLEGKAARYEWLRMCDWFSSPLCVVRDPKRVLTQGNGLGADCPSRERLDEAIDAEIAKPLPPPPTKPEGAL